MLNVSNLEKYERVSMYRIFIEIQIISGYLHLFDSNI